MSTEYRVVPEELLKQCKLLAAMQGDGSTEHFKKLEALLAAPVPPAGGEVEFDKLAHDQVLAICRGAAARCIEQHAYMQGAKTDSQNWFPHKWVVDAARDLIGINRSTCSDLRAHVTRLQAENEHLLGEHEDLLEKFNNLGGELDALKAEVERLKKLLGQAAGMVNGATDEWHDQAAKELRP